MVDNVVAFEMKAGANGDSANGMYFIFNANREEKTVDLPEGNWDVYINGEKAGTEVLETISGAALVEPISALVLVKSEGSATVEQAEDETTDAVSPENTTEIEESSSNVGEILGVILAITAIVVIGFNLYKKKNKK